MGIEGFLFTILGATLYALLYRTKDIVALVKKEAQRTPQEQQLVTNGALRTLLIELLLFVPSSSLLFYLILPVALNIFSSFTSIGSAIQALVVNHSEMRQGLYTMGGIISYNFPFIVVRQIATRIALSALKDFANEHEDLANTPKKIEAKPERKKISAKQSELRVVTTKPVATTNKRGT